ncbi:hypothetical protein ZPAH1_orf00150 [Aeromonas phage ZPAH1]|nr:hypothetical protein ZPAH1_orf00150 [Aeromonas phage ZPAH1]
MVASYNELSEESRTLVKEKIKEVLKDVVHLVFTKVDGTIRASNATLNVDVIVESTGQSTEGKPDSKPRKENPDVVRFFDTDIKEFRTFKIQNLVSVGDKNLANIINSVS